MIRVSKKKMTNNRCACLLGGKRYYIVFFLLSGRSLFPQSCDQNEELLVITLISFREPTTSVLPLTSTRNLHWIAQDNR